MDRSNKKRIVIGSIVLIGTALVKSIFMKIIHKNEDAQCSEWYKQHKLNFDDPYLQSNFVTVDTNRKMVIDGNTGKIIEDFNSYPDPEKAMNVYMKALWSCSL